MFVKFDRLTVAVFTHYYKTSPLQIQVHASQVVHQEAVFDLSLKLKHNRLDSLKLK